MRITNYISFRRQRTTLILILFSLLIFYCVPLYAAQVSLAWDATTSSCDGYRIYMRAEGKTYNFDSPAWSGGSATCTIDDLSEGTYYFVARAYLGTNESANSNEVRHQVVIQSSTPKDSDGDGISDADETNIYGTNPNSSDTDGDGLSDGKEISEGTDPTVVESEAAGNTEVWIEAEDGDIFAPMEFVEDVNASGGSYIVVPDGSGKNTDPSSQSAGYAEYTFNVETSADYLIWSRVIAKDGASNSFFVSMDGGEFVSWHTQEGTEWAWRQIGTSGQNPLIYNLKPGGHTFTVMQREDGTQIDRILVTSDMAFVPTGTGSAELNSSSTHVEIEAESGVISSPFNIDEDSGASAGAYVWAPNGSKSFSSPSDAAGIAVYTFSVAKSDDYQIWGRVLAPSGKDDSFFIAMDDSEFVRWSTARSSRWIWDMANSYGEIDPLVYHLEEGTHTFYIMQREDGTSIDKIIVTNDADYIPE